MDKSLLVRLFGHKAAVLHGDPLLYDRWVWLKRRLPKTRNGERFLDVGCGSGAFSIGAATRGYDTVGLSWDQRNQAIAESRAKLCGADSVTFPIQDVRALDQRTEFYGAFDVAICFENIEHVLDDRKLFRDVVRCLKPGGMLLLTTPNYFYKAITVVDTGPFRPIEDGGHVRRGYTRSMLLELCADSGLIVEEVSVCSGFFSQKITTLARTIRPALLGWALTFPLRILQVLFDGPIARLTSWPSFSVCLVACKPRYAATASTATADSPTKAAKAPKGSEALAV